MPSIIAHVLGLASIAGEARQRAASSLRSVAHRIRCTDIHVERVFRLIANTLDRASGRVAGCGCNDDDAESCASFVGGEWCECSCHGRRP